MSALVKAEPQEMATSILQIITNAATNPQVDIDKMQRLLEMHERIQKQQAEAAFNDAMTACQAEMRPISADAENPQTRSKYATYAKLDRALRPIYTKHGFSLSFDEGDSPKPEHIRVLCYVARGGFTRTYRKDMPADGKGAKGGDVMTKTHATGAAGSYGSRYLLKGIFNVAVGEEDTDGNDPSAVVTEEQIANITALATEVNANMFKFLAYLKVKSLPELPAKHYQKAIRALEAQRGRK